MQLNATGVGSTAHWPFYGQQVAVHFLQQLTQPAPPAAAQTVSRGPRHAYLLLGPRQVGKSTLARIFAQALLCTDAKQRPCGVCRHCQLMQRGTHPDFRLLQPLSKTGEVDRLGGTLRVEQAAEVIHSVALRPMEARHKVFLIQDFHQANDNFANKLLKTLEEPPPTVIFCLTALERSALLPTVVSRCQPIELRPVATSTIATALVERWQADPQQAALLARLANGRIGWAVQQLAEPEAQQTRLAQLQTLWQLMRANALDRLSLAERLATSLPSEQLFALLALWFTWWRDVLMVQSGCTEACCNIDQMAELQQQAAHLSNAAVRNYLRTLQRVEGYLHHTINTRLALEVLLLQIPSPAVPSASATK